MIIIVDERLLVQEAYVSQFEREGYPAIGFNAADFEGWLEGAAAVELDAVRACMIAENELAVLGVAGLALARRRIAAPLLALTDRPNLESTLGWFGAGMNDVVRKPIHFRELLARIAVHSRRAEPAEAETSQPRLRVFADGRDPLVDGAPLALPRRERCVLEYLASIGERRATKAQLHGAVYGMYDESVEETVIESHVSKLRKKLRAALGYDPIESKRYLGYRLVPDVPAAAATSAGMAVPA